MHDEDGGEQGRAGEQVGAVGLDLAGLLLAQELTRALGGGAGAVDDGVDHALVDVLVDPLAARDRRARRPGSTMPSMTFWLTQLVARAIGPFMPPAMTSV